MKEKLIIKNFGPIKSIDLDLGKITVLIGEQASGKSTVAKVLAICRYFSYIVNDSSIINENYESEFVATALRDWGLNGYERNDSYINYISSDYSVEIISEKIEIDKEFSFYRFSLRLSQNQIDLEIYSNHLIKLSLLLKKILTLR